MQKEIGDEFIIDFENNVIGIKSNTDLIPIFSMNQNELMPFSKNKKRVLEFDDIAIIFEKAFEYGVLYQKEKLKEALGL